MAGSGAPRVIAIDGPAGSGKSTVARAVADRLGLHYLDTGAMYRGVAYAVLRAGIDPTDAGDDPSRRYIILAIHVVCGKLREFKERCPRIKQAVNTVSHQQLTPGFMSLPVALSAAQLDALNLATQIVYQGLHLLSVFNKVLRTRINLCFDDTHGLPRLRVFMSN